MQTLFVTGQQDAPLVWEEVESPALVAHSDAIVRPLAVAACDLDRIIANGQSPFPGGFALGHEFTGEVVATGSDVVGLQRGDVVLASFQPSCGTCGRCAQHLSSVCQAVPNGTMYGIGPTGGDWGGALSDAVRVPWADHNLKKLAQPTDAARVASASDNLADGLRAVEGPLSRRPGGSVLVAGRGSIALYAVLCAVHLGAGAVTVASDDEFVLKTAEALGAQCLPVTDWPKRFGRFDVTVDCTNSVEGLATVMKSTAPFGECTSCSIFFGESVTVPMFNLNMYGITFHTGRVNSAANMEHVLALINDGLDPDRIDPAYCSFDEVITSLQHEPFSRKVIACRSAQLC